MPQALKSLRWNVAMILAASLLITGTMLEAQAVAAHESQQPSQPAGQNSDSSNNVSSPPSVPDAPPPQPSQKTPTASSPQEPRAGTATGAAGAQAAKPKGAPAAQPFGAAIAPAKQHQRRSLLVKVGLLAGAGIALGSVVALSKGSPSRPPGATSSANH